MIKLAIFISGKGSTMERIIRESKQGILQGLIDPVVVIADSSNARGLEKAKKLGVPTQIVSRKDYAHTQAFGQALLSVLSTYNASVISQNGWLPLTPANVVKKYTGNIINQHPGPLDPGRGDFGGKGMYGDRVICARLAYSWLTNSDYWTEVTTHFVTEEFDNGLLLLTKRFELPSPAKKITTSRLQKEKMQLFAVVKEVQKQLLPFEHDNMIQTLKAFAQGRIQGKARHKPLISQKNLPILAWSKQFAIQVSDEQEHVSPIIAKREERVSKKTLFSETKKSVLIIGSGGREHAIGWKLRESPQVGELYFAPGNGGTGMIGTNVPIPVLDIDQLLTFAKEKEIDLTVVGSDDPLAEGIVDRFTQSGLQIFGPTRLASRIEWSKAWTGTFMEKYHIPSPQSLTFSNPEEAKKYIQTLSNHVVIKASGLALGKGVLLPTTKKEAFEAIERIMVKKEFGIAGSEIVIQEKLYGSEISVLALSDGSTIVPFLPAQDHKRIFDNDQGPNTGGMGTYAPLPFVSKEILQQIETEILQPTVAGMRQEGIIYRGVLYAGLMLTADGPKVLEFNARFGDPETQVVLPLLKSDLFSLFTACIAGTLQPEQMQFHPGSAACIILASEGYPGAYKKGFVVSGWKKKNVRKNAKIFFAGVIQKDKELLTSGGRVLGVTVVKPTLPDALKTAYGLIGKSGVHFSGMQYRSDIGKKSLGTQSTIHRFGLKSTILDTRAIARKQYFDKVGISSPITDIQIVDVYTIDKTLSTEQRFQIGQVLQNPVNQKVIQSTRNSPEVFMPLSSGFDYAIEIGYHPGVTDNVATTAKETITDKLQMPFSRDENVYTSQITFLSGKVSDSDVWKLAHSLANPLIQSIQIKTYAEYKKENGMLQSIPRVKLTGQQQVLHVNLAVSDDELGKIGKQGILGPSGTRRGPLALDLASMQTIQAYFITQKRMPTDIELESLAQTWSEHCKHTIFANPIDEIQDGLYKTYIKGATEKIRQHKGNDDFCASVFTDNSGAIIFDDTYLLTHKVETHNSPSALDPFGGAITGIVGVNRDAIGFGMGAKPIANTYGFCFGDPTDEEILFKDQDRKQPMLPPRRIMEGVIQGVNTGGNCSGIPTPQGFLYFDSRYKGKPLVFVGTLGLLPRKIAGADTTRKQALPGDYIVMVGGRVGKDGIHGATFSSEAIDSASPVSAVQIGDPITQKKLSDAVVKEARDAGLYDSITDNGAGGLSCSVAEMARESGGCRVDLEKVPLKYPGLDPWEIWISESQERMTLAITQDKLRAFEELMHRRGVEATVIGEFTNSGRCEVYYKGQNIMDIDMEFLHDGLPKKNLHTRFSKPSYNLSPLPTPNNQTALFHTMVSRQSVASFAFISSQYDHEVQSTSVLKPLQGRGRINGDATVIKPVLTSAKAFAISQSLYPQYTELDSYRMAGACIDSAVRQLIVVGVPLEKIALLDNFCWCSSTEPYRLGQLKQAVKACFDYAVAFDTPYISGKDSMFNDFNGYDNKGNSIKISIPPTLLISSVGLMDSVSDVVSLDAKFAGDLVYLIGDTYEELGGSEYMRMINEQRSDSFVYPTVPKVHAARNKEVYTKFHRAIQAKLVSSAQSLGIGGLAVACGKTAMGGKLGMTIDLSQLPGVVTRDDYALYSESQGRILATINPMHKNVFEAAMADTSFACIGEIRNDSLLRVRGITGETIIKSDINTALHAYRQTFKDY